MTSRPGNDWEHVALSASSVTASMQNRFFQTYSNGPVNLITSGLVRSRLQINGYVQSGEAILDVSVNNFRELNGLAYSATEFFAGAVDTIKVRLIFCYAQLATRMKIYLASHFFSPKGYFTLRL